MIEALLITSALIWGIHGLLNPDDNLLFNDVGGFLERILGTTVCKPLFLCPPCMSSAWGVPAGLVYFGLSLKIFTFAICLLGINYVIKKAIYPDYYEDQSPEG